MSTSERLAFAHLLGPSSYLEDDWQTVIEQGVQLIDERHAIEFGVRCVERILGAWTGLFPNDDRVSHAVATVKQWLTSNTDAGQLAEASLQASDAAVEFDDPNVVPANQQLTRALHAANAASSIADAARSAAEPVSQRKLGPHAVALGVGYAARFSILASEALNTEYQWQLKSFRSCLLSDHC